MFESIAHVQLRTGPNVSGYCASKFAVRALNQGAAVELGQHKITANVYCPTVVETEMWEKIDATITSMQGREKGSYTIEVRGTLHLRALLTTIAGEQSSFGSECHTSRYRLNGSVSIHFIVHEDLLLIVASSPATMLRL